MCASPCIPSLQNAYRCLIALSGYRDTDVRICSPLGARAGVIPTGTFLNGTLGAPYVAADGMWYALTTNIKGVQLYHARALLLL